MYALFTDRRDAGRALARKLVDYADDPTLIVLGLPRGGVPVAYEVATALGAPLDVFIVRKLGVPGYQEAAFGAIASGGVRVIDATVIAHLRLPNETIEKITRREQQELAHRERLYRADRPFIGVEGRTVILVDDGIATGASMYAAVEALRAEHPQKLIVAAPVASTQAVQLLSKVADACVCVLLPEMLQAVGLWYEDFTQTSNAQVSRLLRDARDRASTPLPLASAIGS